MFSAGAIFVKFYYKTGNWLLTYEQIDIVQAAHRYGKNHCETKSFCDCHSASEITLKGMGKICQRTTKHKQK